VRIEGEVVIIRPVDQVFDFVADERNEPRYNSRMVRADKTSPGPIGRGSRFLAESAMLGRVVETTIEFTDYERPRLLGSTSRSVVRLIKPVATKIEGTLTFDAVAGGTRMRWAWDVETRGVLKLMSRIQRAIQSGSPGGGLTAAQLGLGHRPPRRPGGANSARATRTAVALRRR